MLEWPAPAMIPTLAPRYDMRNTGVVETRDLSQDETDLFNAIPSSGRTIGNQRARSSLGWEEERYWAVRDSLVDLGLIARGVGRGGTVYRVIEESNVSPAEVTVSVPLDDPAKAANLAVEAVQREDSLYDPLSAVLKGAWARDRRSQLLAVEIIARQGRRATGGTWSRPDIVPVEVLNLLYIPTKILEVVTFEVKPSDAIDVQCVYEALAHRRAATHAYVMLHVPTDKQTALMETLQTVVGAARGHGVGVVTFSDPADYSTWEELNIAERVEPDPERLNQFVETQLPEQVKTKLARELR